MSREDARNLARRISQKANPGPILRRHKGTITDINTNGTVDLKLDGSTVVLSGIRVLTGTYLAVNDVVEVLIDNTDVFVLGKIATEPSIDMTQGTLGYEEVKTSDSDRGGAGLIFDWNDLSVTVDVAAGRRVRVTGHAQITTDNSGDQWAHWVREGSVKLGRWGSSRAALTTDFNTYDGSVILTPSQGEHTYKLSSERIAGSGDATIFASSEVPAFILVEDIGAV